MTINSKLYTFHNNVSFVLLIIGGRVDWRGIKGECQIVGNKKILLMDMPCGQDGEVLHIKCSWQASFPNSVTWLCLIIPDCDCCQLFSNSFENQILIQIFHLYMQDIMGKKKRDKQGPPEHFTGFKLNLIQSHCTDFSPIPRWHCSRRVLYEIHKCFPSKVWEPLRWYHCWCGWRCTWSNHLWGEWWGVRGGHKQEVWWLQENVWGK